jgi:hypothetical protein
VRKKPTFDGIDAPVHRSTVHAKSVANRYARRPVREQRQCLEAKLSHLSVREVVVAPFEFMSGVVGKRHGRTKSNRRQKEVAIAVPGLFLGGAERIGPIG